MIKHIVLWKLDDSYSENEKEALRNDIKEKLMALKGVIGELKTIDVRFNDEEALPQNFDVLLDTEFESFSDLNAYQVHPAHQQVGAFLKSIKLQRAAIDFKL